jgi:hypothetical protein
MKNKKKNRITFLQILCDRPDVALQTLFVTAVIAVVSTLLVSVGRYGITSVRIDPHFWVFWLLVVAWALAGDTFGNLLRALREQADDALRIPRILPVSGVNPSSLIGITFPGVAPDPKKVEAAVLAYLGRDLSKMESLEVTGESQATLTSVGMFSEKTYRWLFDFGFEREVRDGGPFCRLSAARIQEA